jgi:hypothetical protein
MLPARPWRKGADFGRHKRKAKSAFEFWQKSPCFEL